jgi:hypothetical protein
MAGILRIDHNDDMVNSYAQAFRQKLIFDDFASNYPHHGLFVASNDHATKNYVDTLLNANSISYITGSGHGQYEAFFGKDGIPIWHSEQSLDSLKGKIIHLLSCDTGAVLGRAIIETGGNAFWGYTVNFEIVHEEAPPFLFDDKAAAIFFQFDAIIDRGILAGRSSDDIYASLEKYMGTVLPQLSKAPLIQSLLIANFVHLACPVINWGDRAATCG